MRRRRASTVPNDLLVMSYGGGVNSLAVLVGMRERGIRPDAVVFSDTRGEKPETYFHLRVVLPQWLEEVGFPPLVVVCRADFPNSRTGDASLEDECLRLGTLPSRAYGFGTCADKWKIDPFKWWARTWPPAVSAWEQGRNVVRVIGYDAGEERRVGAHVDKGFSKWFPLIEWRWGREECVEAVRRAGLPVPPKSACFYCPSSTKGEVVQLGRKHPDLMGRALKMEDRANATGRWAVKGLGRRFSWREIHEADEAALAEIPESIVESCTTCYDGEGDEA